MSAAGNYNPNVCQYCNGLHVGKCPLVKAIEYFENGTVKRVEFHEPVPVTTSKWPISPPMSGDLP